MKYPRTCHLPQSPGGTRDDRRLSSLDSFRGRTLILSEKLDGSNVCLQADACYARSHGQAPTHPSFDAFKAFHAQVQGRIGANVQLFGEWLYAKHSIHYTKLTNYFMLFGVRDTSKMRWASWAEVELWAEEIGVPTVPVLFRVEPSVSLEAVIRKFGGGGESKMGGEREGFVIRWADEFDDADFERAVAKWVRKDHVSTPHHWKTQEIVRNQLA